PWNKCFHKKIINKYNLRFNEKVSLGEDLIFNLDYLKYVQYIYFDNKSRYSYNPNENSLSAKFHDNAYEMFKYLIDAFYELYTYRGYSRSTTLYNYLANDLLRMVIIPIVTLSKMNFSAMNKKISSIISDQFVREILNKTKFDFETPFFSILSLF